MKRFFDSSKPLLSPKELIRSITGKNDSQLALPEKAIIVFRPGDVKRIASLLGASLNTSWQNFRLIYHLKGTSTIMATSPIGGPGIAALIEELTAFGVRQVLLWGYCGALGENASIGDVIMAENAIREDGVSYHYMPAEEATVASKCVDDWRDTALSYGIERGTIWTCDAIYRETEAKVIQFMSEGVKGVEMEVASFYAVCTHLGIKGIAFLVVSDRLTKGGWESGFGTRPFRTGVNKLKGFVLKEYIS